MFMLETNILVFSIRHPESECAKKLASHVGKDVCISVVTYAELIYGVENSSDPKRNAEALNRFLAGIIILDFNMDAGIHYGRILAELRKKHLDKQNQDRDKMIAAHARSLGYVLVTNNTKDFEGIDGLVLDDWREPGDLEQIGRKFSAAAL